MEIAHHSWLERRPTLHGLDGETLNYTLQLLVENRLVAATTAALRQATARDGSARLTPLRFAVPGSFNGRLFDCHLTLSADEIANPSWKNTLEQKLRMLCRENK